MTIFHDKQTNVNGIVYSTAERILQSSINYMFNVCIVRLETYQRYLNDFIFFR